MRTATFFANESGGGKTVDRTEIGSQPIARTKRYVAPRGFGKHAWGDGLQLFPALNPEPIGVSIAYSPGKVSFIDMQCVPSATGGCDLEKSLRTLHQKVEAEGHHVLAEYSAHDQGFRFSASGVTLYPISWMFCARWGGFTGNVPRDIQARMKLCGVRAHFRAIPQAEVDTPVEDVEASYDKVLRSLISMHGPPDHCRPRPHITVESEEGGTSSSEQSRVEEWRWCAVRGNELAPKCTASIVLALDSSSGWATLLFVTRPVWEFAYAHHQGGAPNNPLYKLLHGLTRKDPVDERCTGTHLCRPDPPKPMSEDTREKFRLDTTLE